MMSRGRGPTSGTKMSRARKQAGPTVRNPDAVPLPHGRGSVPIRNN